MTSRVDISDKVHRILLVYAAIGWAFFLLAWIPLVGVIEGGRVIGLTGALVMSWLATGASVWVSIRVRRRACYWAIAASLPLAIATGSIFAWLLAAAFEPRVTWFTAFLVGS